MKIYCSCCDKVQPVHIDNCRDAKTNEPFQDIVCAECNLVIAAGTDINQEDHQMNTEEDEFKRIEREAVMRKQDDDDIQDYVETAKDRMFAITFQQVVRNQTLEEVAKEFDKMRSLGDTAASFAAYVRNMKS